MSEFKPFCSPRGSARGSLAKEMLSPVVAGRRATILQSPSIIAGLPSAVAWSHPTAEGVPSLGNAPAVVAPGIFGRATALVARIKTAPGYTESIGQALQIIGAEHPIDPTTLKPVLDVELDAGQVCIGWLKQGMDSLELWVDRGTGFVFLAIDTIPNYTDTAAMPPAGQSALWKYKGIYIQADQRVGQWSDVVSIPVAG